MYCCMTGCSVAIIRSLPKGLVPAIIFCRDNGWVLFDGKEVDTLALPNHCIIRSIHRNRKNLLPQGQTLVPGDQVEIEMDAQDIENYTNRWSVWQISIKFAV